MSDIVEQAARVLRQATNDGANKTEDYAQALADAGLLREPERVVPTQDDITDALGPILFNNFNYPKLGESTAPLLNKITDAVLALLADQPTVNEVKAQALEEFAAHIENTAQRDDVRLTEHAVNEAGGAYLAREQAHEIKALTRIDMEPRND